MTLIELLLVTLIIGILAAVALPSLLGQSDKAHDSDAKQALEIALRSAQAAYVSNERFTPALITDLQRDQPQLHIQEGDVHTTDSVRVERISDGRIALRAGSRSGSRYTIVHDQQAGGTVRFKGSTASSTVTNLAPNPSLEMSLGRWSPVGTGTTLTRDQRHVANGDWAARAVKSASSGVGQVSSGSSTNAVPVQGGRTYTFGLQAYLDQFSGAGTQYWLSVTWWNNTIPLTPGVTSTPRVGAADTGKWNTLSLTATAPAGATGADVRFYTSNVATFDVWLDNLIVTATSAPVAYLDGDSPGGSWSGAPHNSSSTGYPGAVAW